MNIIIIIIAFLNIIIKNAQSQLNQSEISVDRQKRDLPDVDSRSNFALDPTLEHKSSFKTIISLWNDPAVKLRIKNIQSSLKPQQVPITGPKKLIANIYETIDHFELPIPIKDNLLYANRLISIELFDFLWEIRESLRASNSRRQLFDDYVDNIQWTDVGKIDRINTLKAVFSSIKNKPSQKTDLKFLFLEACKYCHAEIITEVWRKLQNTDKQDFLSIRNPNDNSNLRLLNEFDKEIILYWIETHLELNDPIDADHRQDRIRNIFETHQDSFLSTNVERLRYFFIQFKPNQNDKDNYILNELLPPTDDFILILDENFVFLMQQLSKEKRDFYLQNNRDFALEHLIDSWPWKYLYFKALEISLKNPGAIANVDWENILKEIVEKINVEYAVFGNYKQTSLWMLEKFWTDYREHFTEGLINTCWSLPIVESSKLRVISIIIQHWNIKSIQRLNIYLEIISGFSTSAPEFYRNKEYNLLYIVAEKIMIDPWHRYLFFQKIDVFGIYNHFIINGDRYNEIERLFDWKFGASSFIKKNSKKNLDWIPIVKNIQSIINTQTFINNKLRRLFQWLDYPENAKVALKKCIDNWLEIEPVNLRKFYSCIKKIRKHVRACERKKYAN
ncbi:hypothetical protein HCN44_003783 [Aphidius gifuensis]|uniref:Uncharacterized protein n=1 Tax=Aphidius gifuensis TaxID=684658 RepID=A0A835CPB3_APHGI|nr:hypothetical protein HCN44_003783 [Aphidius gifuensis]